MPVEANDPVFLKARDVLAKMLKVRPNTIFLTSRLKDDLGIDSVDGLDMSYALENTFGIEIEDYEVGRLHNMGDVVLLIREKSKKRK